VTQGKGIVYLVGAGPGDPGLITVRGAQVLGRADAVVHDTLANRALLKLAPESAERIDVGKKPGHAPVPQERITEMLVKLVRQGKTVVRLKGGDPFVFGRGGEEAIGLAEAGCRFEVVPGVTAGPAALAYAGIPITHRGLAATFALVTGHEDPDKDESAIDWPALTRMGTVAFYMSVRNLPRIVERLTAAGMPADTPAAVVSMGTYPKQQTVTGTLGTIVDLAVAAGVRRPAVTVVGRVVSLRPRAAWFEKRTMFGRTILVTRAKAQAAEFSAALAERGADVIEASVIEIRPPDSWDAVDAAIRRCGSFDWIVFTSVNGVRMFFDRLDQLRLDVRTLGKAKLAAIGPATAAELTRRHLTVELVPDEFVAEQVVAALESRGEISGRSFLLPRADIARTALPTTLRLKGATVTGVDLYRTACPDSLPTEAQEALRQGAVDWITFTSSSTVANFAALAGPVLLASAISACKFASIGPITSRTAADLGIPIHIEAKDHTLPGLLDAMERFETGHGVR